MNICEDFKAVFPDAQAPALGGYYAAADRFAKIYAGEPPWRFVKKSGLYQGGSRKMSLLNAAKVLCDRFAFFTFAEQPELVFSDGKTEKYVRGVLERTGLLGRMTEYLSRAYAMGGCVFRPYIDGGKIGVDCVYGGGFLPLDMSADRINGGCFRSIKYSGGNVYTLFERHGLDDGAPVVSYRLFRGKDGYSPGEEIPVGEIYPLPEEAVRFGGIGGEPLFSCFRTAFTNNIFPDVPLGISVFANAEDTLKAIDVAFDSFAREFILGRKRIIVPSSCVQTVVDIATGEQRQYFDADDEAYVALKCDEERDLKITDNTVELRVDEHIKAINALLNLLCFQAGLAPGTFSFEAETGVKTATEIISRDSKTAAAVRANQHNLGGALAALCGNIARLGVYLGELDNWDCEISVKWRDGIITDENTLIDNDIRLVSSGLLSKVSAIMEIRKCSYEAALQELERINDTK